MALDGWRFLVLSPSYAIHWGFQEKNQQNKLRKMQVNANRRRFNEFEKEVRAKYVAKNGNIHIPGVINKKKILKKNNKMNTSTVSNKEINLKRNGSDEGNSGKKIRDSQPVTNQDSFEYDISGPKFSDDII